MLNRKSPSLLSLPCSNILKNPIPVIVVERKSSQDLPLTISTLPAFAIGLKDGVTSLEFDCGLTKDGAVIVWHDEIIDATKCRDTQPAFEGDEIYPYVGKNVANLTLAQIKTLDCGSLRIDGFPFSGTSSGRLAVRPVLFPTINTTTRPFLSPLLIIG
jgi:glycerophosphoryl diester phosphodiesterase